MQKVTERFIQYAKIHTTSDPSSDSIPSTSQQWDLLTILKKELDELSIKNNLDDKGYLFAYLPGNIEGQVQTLGFLAHVDTSPDFSGQGVHPIITHYQGGDLILNREDSIIMSPEEFPILHQYENQQLIHTDGKTLLGADDKAGIAEIMTILEYLVENPDIQHGPIHVAFTPDEEIGRGAHHFDVEAFGADIAYTVDGGALGELEYENFNAAKADVIIRGRNIHPGSAKDIMINSMKIAANFIGRLPHEESPETTENYEGFYHLNAMQGTVEETTLQLIIRDHDHDAFEAKKIFLQELIEEFKGLYGDDKLELVLEDQYYNMKEKIEPVIYMIDRARKAMMDCGIHPIIKPIRGGTDGSQLSYKGLPCPNLFTGGENFHGRYEFIPVSSMEKACDVILRLIEIYAEQPEE